MRASRRPIQHPRGSGAMILSSETFLTRNRSGLGQRTAPSPSPPRGRKMRRFRCRRTEPTELERRANPWPEAFDKRTCDLARREPRQSNDAAGSQRGVDAASVARP